MPILLVIFLLAGEFASSAAVTGSNRYVPSALNPGSVSAFADAAIPPRMRAGQIPGAAFVVVRGDQVICEKTFGVADLKTHAPVSPDLTLFRVASISKILTAASVLQLVGEHRMDLQRNVNAYLARLHIAPAFGEPVTTADLLSHSGGFDDCQFGYAARAVADRLSLENYLAAYQPVRVRPPGLFSVYDNYGYTLAGYIVQRVSGISFADFVQKQILDPLDMTHSSFLPDADLRRQLATGYWLDGDTLVACRPDYVNITPAAGFCTTASDMAEFLVALLADQRPDGRRMFSPLVLRGLETRQFAAGPWASGRCYGFNRICLAGRTALCQTGQWPGFNSVLLLFPDAHCGLFLAYNLCDDQRLGQGISRRFAGQFIPPDVDPIAKAVPAVDLSGELLAPLLGPYLSDRQPHDVPALGFAREIDVTESASGDLEIGRRLYRPIGPRAFEEIEARGADGVPVGRRVIFQTANGALHLITQDGAYRRVDWAQSARGRVFLLRTATMLLLSGLVLWPVMAFTRFIFRNTLRDSIFPRTRLTFSLAARAMAFAGCALALWFEGSFAVVQWRLRPFAVFYGFPPPVRHLLWALPVLFVMAVALLPFCVLAWHRRIWHLAHRLHYTLLIAALGLFLYAFGSLHLLDAGINGDYFAQGSGHSRRLTLRERSPSGRVKASSPARAGKPPVLPAAVDDGIRPHGASRSFPRS